MNRHTYFEYNGYNVCGDCGYRATTHQHTYRYMSNGDGKTHNAICACGATKTEKCSGLAIGGNTSCSKCGQTIKGGTILKSLKNFII